MKHLIDSREMITVQDIDQAIADARAWLDDDESEPCEYCDLIERLLAIVEDAYGPPEGMG
jgi:hypothetical protein